MKSRIMLTLGALASAAAVILLSGCGEQSGHSRDDHAGHAHAKNEGAAATESGATTPRLSGEKCGKHDAPKEWCFHCDAGLREKGRLWCAEHDRYEDRCWICHPEAQDKGRLWCQEHSLYEDECFLCHPELKAAGKAAAGRTASTAEVLMCVEHGVPEAECGICHPELAAQLKPGESLKVRVPSAGSATMAGVRTGTPAVGGVLGGVECLAEIAFDQNKLAQVAAPVGGIIQSVEVDLGAQVKDGQTVAKIWSATIAEAVAKAVLTHQTLERERKLRAQRVSAERDLQQAEAEHRAACQQARTLGFTEEQIDTFGAHPDEPVMLEVRAPFAGEIVERTAVRGALVDAGKPLMTVTDRSTMWAILSVPESALAELALGQTVELRLESLPGEMFTGKLTWVAAKVDDRTRMASARVEVSNPKGALRANMFARARILTRAATEALVLPASAVQRVEGQPVVFVKLAEDLFEARAVRLGARQDGQLEVLEGLQARDAVVLANGFPLKSQLLISRLGAGCADE